MRSASVPLTEPSACGYYAYGLIGAIHIDYREAGNRR